MSELETKKLQLEIQALENTSRRDRIKFIVDLIQGMSIIVGIFIAINEFLLKDRESENQKSKVTLEYVQKIADVEIATAKDSLKYFRDLSFEMSIDNPREDSLFRSMFKPL